MHQFLKDPFEVGKRISAMTPHLLDEGVDHRAAPAGVLASDEQPVLRAQFGRADRSFGEVVVQLDLAVEEAGLQVIPLVKGIGERFTKEAFGYDASSFAEMKEKFLQVIVVSTDFIQSDLKALRGGGSLFFQLSFDLIDLAHLVEDPGGDAGVVVSGITKFPPNVGQAADGDDVFGIDALDEGAVGSQAVALQVALEGVPGFGVDEDLVEAVVGPAFMPVVERSVLGVVVNPEVSQGGFALAGFQAGDGGFVHFEVVAFPEFFGEKLVEPHQALGQVVLPIAHGVAGQDDAVTGIEPPLLTVKGLVVAEFFGEQVGSQAGGEDAAGKQAGLKGRGDGRGIEVAFANMDLALDDLAGEGGGIDMEPFADFFSEQAKEVRVLSDFRVGDGALDGGQGLQGVAEFVGRFGAFLLPLRFSRRCVFFVPAGVAFV